MDTSIHVNGFSTQPSVFKPLNQPGGKLAKAPHRSPHNHYPTNFKLHRGEKHTHTRTHIIILQPRQSRMRSLAALTFTHQSRHRGRGVLWCRAFQSADEGFWISMTPLSCKRRRKATDEGCEWVKSLCTRANPYLPSAAKILQAGKLSDDGAAAEAQRRGARANKVTELWITAQGPAISGDLGALCA